MKIRTNFLRMLTLFLLSMLALMFAIQSAEADANAWTEMTPVTKPPPRCWCSMAYDSESDKMILFGGTVGYYISNDETWAYDYNTNTWTNMNPAERPSPRARYGIAYDSESDRIILFGGSSGTWPEVFSDETWAYDYNTNTWTNMNPPTEKPSPRQEHGMAYDSESDRVILFSGTTAQWPEVYSNETWAYDYNTNAWTKMNPAIYPSARSTCGMAYDLQSDKVILFGGITGPFTLNDETWSYDYNIDTWTQMNPVLSPLARGMHVMAYDSQSDRVILFGGSGAPAWTWMNETWAYDYNTNIWENMNPSAKPSNRGNVPMAYDSESDRIILFGGFPGWANPYYLEWYYGDTWVYEYPFMIPPPVGGFEAPINMIASLIPWILLALAISVGTITMAKRKIKH